MTIPDDAASAWTGLDVMALLSVQAEPDDCFVSRLNQLNPYHVLFGGQIMGQALTAASATAPDRLLHSMHGYFLRPGNDSLAVRYRVERIRDGRSFTVRKVEAIQGGQTLFLLTCSFHVPEPGWSHQLPMPDVKPPEQLADLSAIMATIDPGRARQLGARVLPAIEVRPVAPRQIIEQQPESRRCLWFRAPGLQGHPDQALHRAGMAWMTDYWISGAAMVQHAPALPDPRIRVASLDHAMWFHRPADAGNWLLLDFDSPSAEGGTGLSRALIYDEAGRLVATAAQESLQRPIP